MVEISHFAGALTGTSTCVAVATPTSRHRQRDSRKKQILSPNLTTDHKPKFQQRVAHFGLGFTGARRGPFASSRDSLESRSLSSEGSRLQGLIAVSSWRWLRYVENENNVIYHTCRPMSARAHNKPAGHVNVPCSLHHQRLYKLEGCTRKKAGFWQH